MAVRKTALFRFDEKVADEFALAHGRPPCLVGIDEAGRGPWAGPVVASAAVLSPEFFDRRLNDCKLVSPSVRTLLFSKIRTEGETSLQSFRRRSKNSGDSTAADA